MSNSIRNKLFRFKDKTEELWDHGWRRTIMLTSGLLIALPLLALPLPTALMTKTIFVTFLMAFYWITETLPIAVTSLIPVALFPFFGIVESDKVSSAYFNDTIFLFVGSFIVALAMEKWELHRRFALYILTLVGSRPRMLLLAFMFTTGFMSMWMSNTSTASVMVPLVMTTIRQLQDFHKKTTGKNTISNGSGKKNMKNQEKLSLLSDDEEERMHNSLQRIEVNDNSIQQEDGEEEDDESSREEFSVAMNDDDTVEENQERDYVKDYGIALLLSVCYASSIGGTATIIGTGPNLIFKSQMKILFPNAPEISFVQWFLFAFPAAFVMMFGLWIAFCFFYVKNPDKIQFEVAAFKQQLHDMGPMKFGEKAILIDLLIMVLLWFSRVGVSENAPGWGSLFHNYPGDGTVAVLMAAMLFAIPSSRDGKQRVMDWESTKELPWNIILLLGAGFALAKGISNSGLSNWIGDALRVFDSLPRSLLVITIVLIITFTTEVTSNVATANICLPILASISISIGENPLLLMVPGTISTSYAFMLPVATPPNAIVFASGMMRIKDMVVPGFFLNIFAIILLPTWMFVFGLGIFDIDLGKTPAWLTTN